MVSAVFYCCNVTEHEHAMTKFMKIPKKKDVQDSNEELYMMRKKYHQVMLELASYKC